MIEILIISFSAIFIEIKKNYFCFRKLWILERQYHRPLPLITTDHFAFLTLPPVQRNTKYPSQPGIQMYNTNAMMMMMTMTTMMMMTLKRKNKERSVVVHVFSDIVFAIRCLCHSTLSFMMMMMMVITMITIMITMMKAQPVVGVVVGIVGQRR